VTGLVRFGSRLCENALGRRMRRIVFSIAFFRKKLPVQSTPTSTKSRWKFYKQVGHRSFHTAWVRNGSREPYSIFTLLVRRLKSGFGAVGAAFDPTETFARPTTILSVLV
jgi:hypothetical protein